MTQKKILSSNNLEELVNLENVAEERLINAKLLRDAINDFPIAVAEPIDFLKELKREINDSLTFDKISKFQQTLTISKDAWKIESLTQILSMFENDREKTLEDLMVEITEIYNQI
jgi:hypothetical protein